jgi:hypothetical protein
MRKIAFVKKDDPVRKLMIYEEPEGAYLFGYDRVEDGPCIWDQFFQTVDEAEGFAYLDYDVAFDTWITISDPTPDKQHDLIADHKFDDKSYRFAGMTGNERLFVSGLMYEFDIAKIHDKVKAAKILQGLDFDAKSIQHILLS